MSSTTITSNDTTDILSEQQPAPAPAAALEAISKGEEEEEKLAPVDPEVEAFVLKLNAMSPTTHHSDAEIVQVLEESWELLQQKRLDNQSINVNTNANANTDNTSTLSFLQSMQQLLDNWHAMQLQHKDRMPKTSRPFEILLQAWTQFPNGGGSKACAVLRQWYEILGGDLALAPTMADFHQVLAAYAATTTNNNNYKKMALAQMAAQEAWDVVQELHHWGYTMEPTLETNAHLIRCLAKVVQQLPQEDDHHATIQQQQADNNDNIEETVMKAATAWERLHQVMDEAILPVALKYLDQNNKKATLFERQEKEHQKELFYLSQALSDALGAAKQYSYKSTQQQQQQNQNLEPAFHLWGHAWSDIFLKHPDRMETLLDYYGESPSQEDLPAVFYTLTRGCEAWQSLLYSYYSKQQQNQQPNDNFSVEALQQVYAVLEPLEHLERQRYDDTSHRHEVYYELIRSYLLAIKALVDASPYSPDSQAKRDQVLQQLQEQHFAFLEASASSTGSRDAVWTEKCTNSWNALLSAKFHAGEVDQVHQLWNGMRQGGILGDATTYSIVLKALADGTQMKDAAPQAHSIWKKLIAHWHRNPTSPKVPKPTGQHYASVMIAWSRSRIRNAADKAMEVFHQLERDYESSHKATLKPKPIHYSALLTTLVKSLTRYKDSNSTEAIHSTMMELIDRMVVSPKSYQNSVACSAALNALSKIGTQEAALLAQHILDEMEYRSEQHQQDHQHGGTTRAANVYHYGNAMLAWSRAAEKGDIPDANIRVEGLLQRLESEFEKSGRDPSLLPSEIVYCALLNSIIASGKMGIEERAEEVLYDMERKAAEGLAAPPNDFVYCKVIAAHRIAGQSDCGERAEAVLQRMKEMYNEQGIIAAKPTAYAYNGVMQAWAKSPSKHKAEQAARLLKELRDAYAAGELELKPSIVSHSAVLQCCVSIPADADADIRQEAVRIALETVVELDVLDSDVEEKTATPLMYQWALKTVGKLSEDNFERRRIVSALFKKCCDEGIVNGPILAILKHHTPELYRKLPGGGKHIEAFPKAWTWRIRSQDVGNRIKHY